MIRGQTLTPLPQKEVTERVEEVQEASKTAVESSPIYEDEDAEFAALIAAREKHALASAQTKKKNAKQKQKQKQKSKQNTKKKAVGIDFDDSGPIGACWLALEAGWRPEKHEEKKSKSEANSIVAEKLMRNIKGESWAGEAYENGGESKTFRAFSKFLKIDSHIILRYQMGAKPLWISDPPPFSGELPTCFKCGGKCIFEMQIFPSLLFLGGELGLWKETQKAELIPEVFPEFEPVEATLEEVEISRKLEIDSPEKKQSLA